MDEIIWYRSLKLEFRVHSPGLTANMFASATVTSNSKSIWATFAQVKRGVAVGYTL